MEIRTQHNIVLDLSDVTELLAPRLIKILDPSLETEALEITFDPKTKKFTVTVDITWEPDLESGEESEDPEDYDYVIHLESGGRLRENHWGSTQKDVEEGSTVLLVRRDGSKVIATVVELESDGDLWVTVGDSDEWRRVTNFNDDDSKDNLDKVQEIHYNT